MCSLQIDPVLDSQEPHFYYWTPVVPVLMVEESFGSRLSFLYQWLLLSLNFLPRIDC